MTTNRVNSPLYLDARFRSRFLDLAKAAEPLGFRIFESWRSDEEQLRVFNLGMSKARPGESAHNWGLAADFVPYDEHGVGWHWPKASDPLWDALHGLAATVGLEAPIEWDKPHIQVPNWRELRRELARTQAQRMYAQRH